MAKVEVYTADYCPYCTKAKALLSAKGVDFTEVEIAKDDDKAWADLREKANGMRTIPQIFIDDKHVGGFADIDKLNKNGELDKLLAA